MKRRDLFLKYAFFVALLLGLASSCKKKDSNPYLDDNIVKSGLPVSGAQQVPVVSTTGSAMMDVAYSPSTQVLNYNLRWSDLSSDITAMHIHGPADPGQNAGVLVPITNYLSTQRNGQLSGKVTLDNVTMKQADLIAGKWYINIHTASHPNGEIRGQIRF